MKLLRNVLLVGAAALLTSSQASAALRILWPHNNAVVRESVQVAVLASSVPQDSYVTFLLNNTFMESVGYPKTISGGRKAFAWSWDTRTPLNLGKPNEAPKRPSDGVYDITAQVVGSDGKVSDRAVIQVRLANRVTSVSANKPITLKYHYVPGTERKYAVRIGVSVAEVGGAPVTTTQEVHALAYTGVASVEDLRTATTALMRFKPGDTNFVRFGKPVGPLQGFDAGSIYQVVDVFGRVQAADLFSTVGVLTSPEFVPDYRTPLPRVKVRSGDQWTGMIGVSLPQMGEAARADCTCILEGLEWAGGKECAKIDLDFSGLTKVTMNSGDQSMGGAQFGGAPGGATVPGEALGMAAPAAPGFGSSVGGGAFGSMAGGTPGVGAPAHVKGTGSDWFAFRTGELIRRELTADVEATLDSNAASYVTEGLGLGTSDTATAAAATPGSALGAPAAPGEPGAEEYNMARGMAAMGEKLMGAMATPADTLSQGVKVKFRVRVSAKLVR